MQPILEQLDLDKEKGAVFSASRRHRFALWRIWDRTKPLVMFIGLNPSTADALQDDPTIESVGRLSRFNGYGGFVMTNCWSFVSTDPKLLDRTVEEETDLEVLEKIASICQDVVFAWGNFKIVKQAGRHDQLTEMFPNAKCIMKNKNGSPGHPLFKKGTTTFCDYFLK